MKAHFACAFALSLAVSVPSVAREACEGTGQLYRVVSVKESVLEKLVGQLGQRMRNRDVCIGGFVYGRSEVVTVVHNPEVEGSTCNAQVATMPQSQPTVARGSGAVPRC